MKTITTLFLFIASGFLFVVHAQDAPQTEYGKNTDLAGLHKVFIDTGGDTDNRGLIIKEIEKAKIKDLILLDSSDDAEIIIQFAGGKEQRPTGTFTNGTGEMDSMRRSFGKGIVYLPKKPHTMHVIFSIDDTKENALDKKPSVKLARLFVKAYNEANGVEKK